MQFKVIALALVSAAIFAGCSKETAPAAKPANQAAVPAGPKVEVASAHMPRLEAASSALRAMVDQAKKTKDLQKLAPSIQSYMTARDALMNQMPDNAQRLAGFRDLMQKTLVTAEDRKAYGEVMSAYNRALSPQQRATQKK